MLIASNTGRAAPLGTLLEDSAQRHGERPVIVDRASDVDPRRPLALDYGRLAEFVHDVSGWLAAAGVEPWDRVAIMKRNHFDVIVLACAAARLGAIPAQLAWTHPPAVTETLLRRLDRPVLVIDRERLRSGGLDEAKLRALTKLTIVVGGDPDRCGGGHAVALDAVKGAAAPPAAPRRDEEPMIITHTSGTTGVPKLVIHSAASIGNASRYERRQVPVLRIRREDTVALCDPYFHVRLTTGLVGVTHTGPKLVLLSDPEPGRAVAMLAEHPPTLLTTVPNAFLHWEPFVRSARSAFSGVRLFFSTYDAIHARTVRTFLEASRRRFPVWVQAWGQSETGPLAMSIHTRRAARAARRGPVTQAIRWPVGPETHFRAVDPITSAPVGRGRVGVIEVRREPCLDYVAETERHRRKLRGAWWNTGDLGVVTRTGAVRLLDREVDRIPGGASCIEIEDRLLERIEDLTEVIVLAVQDGDPVPVVSVARDRPLERDAWARATADLPPLAEPRVIRWEEFPRTATWKVVRHHLRERLLPGALAAGTGRWT